jgi:hypothetical protein
MLRGEFVEHLKSDLSSMAKCDRFITITVMDLVIPKAAAKHDLLFNKPASGGLYNIYSTYINVNRR